MIELDEDKIESKNLSLKLFLVLLRATTSITKRVEEDIKTYGLNTTEFGVLELLYHKGDHPIQKIGEKILLASSSITYVVDKLEKKELLVRKPCEEDRRIIYTSITEKGKSLMNEIFPKHTIEVEKLFSVLSNEEKEEMIKTLKILGHTTATRIL